MNITTEELIAQARERVSSLRVTFVDAKPEDFDFGTNYVEDSDDHWDFMEAAECDECGQMIVDEDDHGFLDPAGNQVPRQALLEGADLDDDDLDEWADGNGFTRCSASGESYRDFDQAEGPMMNYRYPIGEHDYTAENAHKIADLPLCLIETPDANYLALTGGGMDLSWEICEAYARLGYLPPSHFDLPGMAGKRLTERTAFIIAAVERSNEVLGGWAEHRQQRTARMFTELVADDDWGNEPGVSQWIAETGGDE
jgi:hypothetical protein